MLRSGSRIAAATNTWYCRTMRSTVSGANRSLLKFNAPWNSPSLWNNSRVKSKFAEGGAGQFSKGVISSPTSGVAGNWMLCKANITWKSGFRLGSRAGRTASTT